MQKIIIKITSALILLLVIGGLGYFGLVKFNGLSNPFESKKPHILETPTIVNEIKSIAELYSVCYYDQLVIDSVRKEVKGTDALINFFGGSSTTNSNLVLLATAKVFAGYDLSKLDSTDINAKDSVITIHLPAPKIIDIVMNPSDVSTFIEEGKWTMNEVNSVKNKAVERFRGRAIKKGIIADAEKKGRESISLFFKSLGFKEVIIQIKNS
ncbi:MAG: DUF4230 domain-containing protein [Bacteroidota bacterium]|jgi:hypothetical protein